MGEVTGICCLNTTRGVTLVTGGAHSGVNSSSQPGAKQQHLDLEIKLVTGCGAEGKWAGGGGGQHAGGKGALAFPV